MSAAIQIVLTLIANLLPTMGLASTSVAAEILQALIALTPVILAEAQEFVTPVKNIIEALKTHGNLTPVQLAALKQLDAQIDAAFDAAVAADPELATIDAASKD